MAGDIGLPIKAAADIDTPASGKYNLFLNSADSDQLYKKSSAGVSTLVVAAGTGTVTSVSVVSANGFTGSVATSTTTPAITITTSINSPVLAGNGTALIAATTTGTGSTVVLNTSPTLVTPLLGTPTSGVLTNCTGLPLTTGVTGVLPTANGGTAVNIATQILTTGAGITNESGAAVSRIRMSANNNVGKILSWATGGLARWAIRVDGNETGANVGGDIALRRYDDAGTYIDNVWSSVRSTGAFTFEKPFYGTSSLTLGAASTTVGSIVLQNATNANTVTINSGVTSASYALTLPTAQGGASTVLTNNGAGVLSWASASSGITIGGTTITSGADNRILFQDATANDFVTQTANFTMGSVASGFLDVPTGLAIAGSKFIQQNGGNASVFVGNSMSAIGTQTGSHLFSGWAMPNAGDNFNTAFGFRSLHNGSGGGDYNTAIGYSASWAGTTMSSTLALGAQALPTASNQCVIGAPEAAGGIGVYDNVYFNGVTHTAPASVTLHSCSASGTNIAGANFTIAGGKSTGSAAGGSFIVQTSTTLGSGTTLQSLVSRLTISGGAVTTDASTATWADALDFVFGSTTGTKIGTATTQKIAFYNSTPIVQPTTAVATSTFVANTSGIVDDSATFGGYKISQIVKALQTLGLLA